MKLHIILGQCHQFLLPSSLCHILDQIIEFVTLLMPDLLRSMANGKTFDGAANGKQFMHFIHRDAGGKRSAAGLPFHQSIPFKPLQGFPNRALTCSHLGCDIHFNQFFALSHFTRNDGKT